MSPKRLQMSLNVSKCLQMSPNVSKMSPNVSKCLQCLQMSPKRLQNVSKCLQMSQSRHSPPTGYTNLKFLTPSLCSMYVILMKYRMTLLLCVLFRPSLGQRHHWMIVKKSSRPRVEVVAHCFKFSS